MQYTTSLPHDKAAHKSELVRNCSVLSGGGYYGEVRV